MNADYEQFTGFFDELADAAGKIALAYFRKSFAIDDKEDKTPVTQADREIEQKLRALIKETYPTHGIIGEEYGKDNPGAEFVWVIDPIDGTKAFATGRPTFGTIIGLAHNGAPMAGLIDQAFSGERWFGITGTLCRYNGSPVKVAAPRPLKAARFHATAPSMFDGGYEKPFDVLCASVKWPIFSCDCYAYGLLALGWLDLIAERKLKVHDVTGVVPIVSGAGGYSCDFNGRPVGLDTDGTIIAASSQELAAEAMEILRKRQAA